MSTTPVLRPVRPTFRAVAVLCVPASQELDEAGWARVESIVEDALGGRPASVRRQLVLFLRIIEVLAVIRHGRRLGSLSAARAQAFLSSLERLPLLAVRRGVWGVRTLAFMGYYGQHGVHAELGYRALAEGWAARLGSAGEWADRDDAAGPERAVLDVLERAREDA
jgi:hypothetical protein